MAKSSAEVEREVEATRGPIGRTVEALKEKMQPKELFDEATRIMGGTSNKVLATVVEQAKANPIPIALIGAGVAWLALSMAKRKPEYDPYSGAGYYETYEGYEEHAPLAEKLKAKARGAVDAARTRFASAREKAAEAVGHARAEAMERASEARDKAAGLAGAVQGRATGLGRKARQRYQEILESEPLILGAVGLAIGVAIGASFAASRAENRYVGPVRDKPVGRGREAARSSLKEARAVAERAYGQVNEELRRQTGPDAEGTTLSAKAKAVADAGVNAVREDMEGRVAH
ncbi:DUF3618 domain-containing protein [Phenylobacterium sp.]|uniref:DUF3618 domain-containing protein n=1 Tax=Phenylobacterium sp. TaxID=1871053 RepID=UPI00391C6F7B